MYVKRHGKEVAAFKIRFLLLIRKYNKLKEAEPLTDLLLFWLFGSIIYGTDESELILQPHFYFRY
ncbi:hypothetical protein EWI08_06945 [Enterococcus faecium]|nr:hypothetical protein CXH17_05200 [Enterococcus faecium]AVJ45490.1 hypothetical protein CXR19_08365 [Enterococcus faecium]AZQ17359.1 hypothetical protein EBB55_06390 [Enterococcus faecium]KAB7617551.1 hypothetical protein GBM44_06175 [Enterococcus faecium]MBO6437696.1 hypothetical protein [Enterococcus faecium]